MRRNENTFALGRYEIIECDGLDGCCDTPHTPRLLGMYVLRGGERRALINQLHEMMHAEGLSERQIHAGAPDRIGDALWRMDWRRREQ